VSKLVLFLFIFLHSPVVFSQVSEEQSRDASEVIGKWLSKSTGHYDFLSATTVNPKRAGTKFFGIPAMQFASEYGFSYMESPRDIDVTNAYKTIGADTGEMARSIKMSRFHLNFGFDNKHDLTFSYLIPTSDGIRGWGAGYKRVLVKHKYIYISYRVNYSRSFREDYFTNTSIMNDIGISVYLRLIDFYAGLRHWAGQVSFESTNPVLALPTHDYFSSIKEIEHYFGIRGATTTNTRFTLEANSIGRKHAIAGKFSFHFDSLLPTMNNWFRDPRYIKQ
jgi:hypothetical protein